MVRHLIVLFFQLKFLYKFAFTIGFTPNLKGKVLILADTMMATGSSFMLAYERLVEEGGKPEQTHIVCPIACEEAVDHLKKRMPRSVTLWTAAVDQELTGHALVVPGLGDAGDLAYGSKL